MVRFKAFTSVFILFTLLSVNHVFGMKADPEFEAIKDDPEFEAIKVVGTRYKCFMEKAGNSDITKEHVEQVFVRNIKVSPMFDDPQTVPETITVLDYIARLRKKIGKWKIVEDTITPKFGVNLYQVPYNLCQVHYKCVGEKGSLRVRSDVYIQGIFKVNTRSKIWGICEEVETVEEVKATEGIKDTNGTEGDSTIKDDQGFAALKIVDIRDEVEKVEEVKLTEEIKDTDGEQGDSTIKGDQGFAAVGIVGLRYICFMEKAGNSDVTKKHVEQVFSRNCKIRPPFYDPRTLPETITVLDYIAMLREKIGKWTIDEYTITPIISVNVCSVHYKCVGEKGSVFVRSGVYIEGNFLVNSRSEIYDIIEEVEMVEDVEVTEGIMDTDGKEGDSTSPQ